MKIIFTLEGVSETDVGNIRRLLATLGMLCNGSIGASNFTVDVEPEKDHESM